VVAYPLLDCWAVDRTVGGELLDLYEAPGAVDALIAPTGAVEEGNPDGGGRARRNNIKPGSCMVSFPDLDGEAWESV
jgi:hypothetical protein